MLLTSIPANLLPLTTSYLRDVLGIEPLNGNSWARADELPYFLQDTFHFEYLELLGLPVILALCRDGAKKSLGDVRTWLNTVNALAGQRVVYVTGALASFERRRLIELKVPFIVPGNQLYLPDLGLDLREYFRQPTVPAGTLLSPSTQAMVITALLTQRHAWVPSYTATALGYSAMTLSRAIKEFTATGLAVVGIIGAERGLKMELPPDQLWERLKLLLRSPVKRTVWVEVNNGNPHLPSFLAGLSALARCTLIGEPKWPTFAITAAQWQLALKAGVREISEPTDNAQQWQLWSYSPELVRLWSGEFALNSENASVDPLSLTLSLRNNSDDRVQIALGELRKQFPW